MGCCDFSQDEMVATSGRHAEPTEQTPLLFPPQPQRMTSGMSAQVALSSGQSSGGPGASTLNSVSMPPPPVCYVIVGRGPAAVINNTTLQQSAFGMARVDGLPILHIGFRNPWPSYLPHGMGQPACLLSLPGFHAQPNALAPGQHDQDIETSGGLKSRLFGAAINAQLQRLMETTDTNVLEGWLAWVQLPGDHESMPPEADYANEDMGGAMPEDAMGPNVRAALVHAKETANAANNWPPDANYRLFVLLPRERRFEVVYAKYIDFCTGPGRPNVVGNSELLRSSKTVPWLSPEVWPPEFGFEARRVLNGVDAILESVPWARGERVCVTAGGGVGLNVAEKARDHDAWLDWFGRRTLIDTFDNPRNHTFLAHPDTGAALERGQLDDLAPKDQAGNRPAEFQLRPPLINLRFGRLAELDVAAAQDDQIEVRLKGGTGEIMDQLGHVLGLDQAMWACHPDYIAAAERELPSLMYDRLVLPNGQQANALGQPARLTVFGNFTPIVENDRMVGLQANGGTARLLGAAAQVYPGFGFNPATNYATAANTPPNAMWLYRATLPVSAVPDGFILSGSNIATANHYFDDFPNRNINTMTLAELRAVVPTPAVADYLHNQRSAANGYRDLAAVTLRFEQPDAPPLLAPDEAAIADLDFGYPPAL